MQFYIVYTLKLSNGDFYVGVTGNLKTRVKEHSIGQVDSTRKYLPVSLVSFTTFTNKKKALAFEKYLKTGSGIAFRNKHLV